MAYKFAHMADLHIGATSDPKMRELELQTLEWAFDMCLKEGAQFVIMAGDIFHINIPDLDVVRGAVEAFKRFADTGRKIYIVYGSHDFSPNTASIIDIIEAAGLVTRVGKPQASGDKLLPEVIRDVRTGATLTGVSGRRALRERDAFEALDRQALRALGGFKIFVFHTSLDEIKKEGEKYESMPSSLLPDGFNYYAGGHIHRTIDSAISGRRIVYPGPLFTGWGGDLEDTVGGMKRGFFMVEVDDIGKVDVQFIENKPFEGIRVDIKADGMSTTELNNELATKTSIIDVDGKVVVIKVHGILSSGKTSDVNFAGIRKAIIDAGAIYLHLSRNQLKTKDLEAASVQGETTSQIEEAVLKEMSGGVKCKNERLRGACVDVAKQLLAQLRSPKLEGESLRDYNARMRASAKAVLGFQGDDLG